MHILGVDPATTKMGLALMSAKASSTKGLADYVAVIETRLVLHKTQLKGIPKILRLMATEMGAGSAFMEWFERADIVVVEKPFGIKGDAKALVDILGAIEYLCTVHGKSLAIVAQSTLKKFVTGNGRAEKPDMIMRARDEFEFKRVTDDGMQSVDEVEAAWLAMLGLCLIEPGSFQKFRQEAIKAVPLMRPEDWK